MADLGKTAPDYGSGAGPVYLSGQTDWYSGGQTAVLMVDPAYSGPLTVRAVPWSGASTARITLADLPATDLASIAAQESQHAVAVVPAVHTPVGRWSSRQILGPPVGERGSGG